MGTPFIGLPLLHLLNTAKPAPAQSHFDVLPIKGTPMLQMLHLPQGLALNQSFRLLVHYFLRSENAA